MTTLPSSTKNESFFPSRSRVALVVCLALLSTLPVANWIAGGHDAMWYGQLASEWVSGSAIAVGLGLILAILSRRLPLWREGLGSRVALLATQRRHMTGVVLALSTFSLYALVAWRVYDRRPLLIDELVQVIQARIFATGRLTLPTPQHPEFFSILNIVDLGGRWYSQFPPGGPFMLMLGALMGAVWLVGPMCGAIAVGAFWYLMTYVDERPTVVLGASLLFAFAPFMVFMSASHMNHVPTLMWSLLALLCFARASECPNGSPWLSFSAGVCFGMMASIRPVDGAAFALPVGLWMLWAAVTNRRLIPALLAAGLGVAIPCGLVLLYNAKSTGDPFLFGYELLWGKSHGLGFHRAPWGFVHTPARGLELINIYLLRLQSYLFESLIPALIPAVTALAICSRFSRLDKLLLTSSVLLLLGYFAYWHDGFYLGPRFLYPLIPVVAIWTARFLAEVRRATGSGSMAVRISAFSLMVSTVIGAIVSLPSRVRQYHSGLAPMRVDYTEPAARAHVENSLILVRESWGAQIVARLWALGVPRTETETLYRSVDSCVLQQAITSAEDLGVRDSVAMRLLMPLLRDSARVVKTELSPDRTERILPGATYSPICLQRIAEDRAGFTLLAPLHALDPGSNIYARDLHARDSLLIKQYPDRPIYLLRPATSDVGAPVVLKAAPLDSLRHAWELEATAIRTSAGR